MYAYGASEIGRVDVRFLQRECFRFAKIQQWQRWRWLRLRFRWEEWQNDDQGGIKIVKIHEDDKSGFRGNSVIIKQDNKAAGMRLLYDPPTRILADDMQWFTIEIDAQHDWSGWISFEAAMEDGRKARSHRRAVIAATRQ